MDNPMKDFDVESAVARASAVVNAQHRCPATGCTVFLDRHILMCRRHWCMVPRFMRAAVMAAWRGHAQGSLAWEAYWPIRQQAVAAVNALLAPVATPDGGAMDGPHIPAREP